MAEMETPTKYVVRTGAHRGDTHPLAAITVPAAEPAATTPAPAAPPPPPVADAEAPRTLHDLLPSTVAETTSPPATSGVVVKPWMLATGLGAVGLAIVLAIVAFTTPATPTTIASPLAQAVVASPLASPTAAPEPTLDLSALAVQSANSDSAITVSASGAISITVASTTTCMPTWSSPPPAWGDPLKQFLSERNGCIPRSADLHALGWWGSTNWVFLTRPKQPGANLADPKQVDLVWSDITWYGHTLAEVQALPQVASGEIKDYETHAAAQAPAPAAQPAAPAQAPSQPWSPPIIATDPPPPDPPTATPAPEPTAPPAATEPAPYYVGSGTNPEPTPAYTVGAGQSPQDSPFGGRENPDSSTTRAGAGRDPSAEGHSVQYGAKALINSLASQP